MNLLNLKPLSRDLQHNLFVKDRRSLLLAIRFNEKKQRLHGYAIENSVNRNK